MGTKSYRRRVDALAATWRAWAELGEGLTAVEWSRPTRCPGWDVRSVYAHHSAFPLALATPPSSTVSPKTSPLTAAQVLREFNAPGGVAHRKSDDVASSASDQAATLSADGLVGRFRDQGPRTVQTLYQADADLVVPWVTEETPTTIRELVRIVLMEAVVHLLDVQRALNRVPEVDTEALTETVRLLAEMAPGIQLVEAATGRTPSSPFPLLR